MHLRRITPTCVGKTWCKMAEYDMNKDHPHVRGENRDHDDIGSRAERITPTCVGKTLSKLPYDGGH